MRYIWLIEGSMTKGSVVVLMNLNFPLVNIETKRRKTISQKLVIKSSENKLFIYVNQYN